MIERYKKVDLEQGTKEWLDWRNSGIGGSDIFYLVAGEQEMLEQLAYHKIHDISFNFSKTTRDAMERGHTLEPVARKLIEEVSGIKFETECLELIENPFIKVSLDGISANRKTIIEIKCLGLKTHDDVARTDVIPERYWLQIQFQLYVSGARRALYVGYNPDSAVKTLYLKEIKIHWETIAKIMSAIENFQSLYNRFRSTPDIVLLTGYAQQGKDEIGKILAKHGYQRIAFADELKEEAVELGILPTNYTEEDKIKARPDLVALGKRRRDEDPDYWLKKGIEKIAGTPIGFKDDGSISYFGGKEGIFDFTDGRYINELYGVQDYAAENNLSMLSLWVDLDGVPANEEEAEKTTPLRRLVDMEILNRGDLEHLEKIITGVLNQYGQ